jgi:hypothetical protein
MTESNNPCKGTYERALLDVERVHQAAYACRTLYDAVFETESLAERLLEYGTTAWTYEAEHDAYIGVADMAYLAEEGSWEDAVAVAQFILPQPPPS